MKRKRLISGLLLCVTLCSAGANVFAKENVKVKVNEIVQEKSLRFHVKRKWYVVPMYLPYGEEPEYIFYEDNGFKGYLYKRTSFPYEGTAVIYEGYLYSGDQYPTPPDLYRSSLPDTKTVQVYVKYTGDIIKLPNYWYDEGGYKGWLYEKDADVYENSDGTWDVYYKGEVIYCPQCLYRSK